MTEWLMGLDWRIGLVLFGLAGLWWALYEIDLIERADREERRRVLSGGDAVGKTFPLTKESVRAFRRRGGNDENKR